MKRPRSRTRPNTNKRGRRGKSGPAVAAPQPTFPMRLNRYIARSGVCSRREADELIKAGRIKIDGAVVRELSTRVEASQRVEVNGKLVSPVTGVYLLLNKPVDTITTKSDEKGRKTVLDLVDLAPTERDALFPVGRLDRDTSGVLLLTSDGDLAHRLMHPSFEVEKLYRVRTANPVTDQQVAQLTGGIELEDGLASADRATYIHPPSRDEVGVAMHSGRNRIVRRMFEALGHDVKQLERIKYAGLTTAGVRRGNWRRLTQKEVERLYRAVKMKL